MQWSEVRERLIASTHYWVSTANANGAPLLRPLHGVWVNDAFWFSGDPATRWRRNIAINAQACLVPEDVSNPVIIEGTVTVIAAEPHDAKAVAEATQEKYGWGSVEQYRDEVCRFLPSSVVGWSGTCENATRFEFSTA